ncbi:hypothetical protein B9Z55_016731 [Caenorhabditis nigoni]|uniref:F-box domain-containing protein n=2 Tax=Caenorhabditis nigoni TaxID=1611254 RepID=A0A2G5T6A9_9PELO|nr:hypothetical protein B9Z55_016731 [Caenorhabditis nigoni]
MPINLHKLPSLVGEMLVTELEYQEIFLLSMCSRRSKILVKKGNIKVPKLAFRYEERHGYNKFEVEVVTDESRLPVTSWLHVPELASEEVSTVKLGLGYKADTSFHVLCENDGKFLHWTECANEPMAVQKSLQDHVNSMFHNDTNQLILLMKYKGSLPNITDVTEIEIRDDTVDPQFITNVLDMYPDHQRLYVKSEIDGEIPKESPFFQVQNIYVTHPPSRKYSCGPDYFHNFVGRNMRLDQATVTEQDLIQFLHKWISNEAYHNLETMVILVGPQCRINENLIRQTIEFEEYDPNEPEKRPSHFPIDIPFSYNFPLRNQNVVEIKRETDRKRAFVYLTIGCFLLVVHKN